MLGKRKYVKARPETLEVFSSDVKALYPSPKVERSRIVAQEY